MLYGSKTRFFVRFMRAFAPKGTPLQANRCSMPSESFLGSASFPINLNLSIKMMLPDKYGFIAWNQSFWGDCGPNSIIFYALGWILKVSDRFGCFSDDLIAPKPIATRFPWIYWNLLTNPDTFRMCWREVGDEDDFVICGSKPNCKGAKESRRKLHVDLRGLRLPKDPFHLFFDGSEVASSSDKFSSWSLLLAFDCLNFGHSRFEGSKKLTS